MTAPCSCDEAKLPSGVPARSGGALVPNPRWVRAHDCAYIKARNRLIPDAERMADAAVMAFPGTETLHFRRRWALWGAEFCKAMDELWRARSAS